MKNQNLLYAKTGHPKGLYIFYGALQFTEDFK